MCYNAHVEKVISPGQRIRVRPDAPLYAGREAKLAKVLPDGKWRVSFTEFTLLGHSHDYDPVHLSPVRATAPTILAENVRPGDLIGLGPGLALRVDQTIFDGDDGLLIGRADCDGAVTDTRHGSLRHNQPYAAVVARGAELQWREGFHPEPIVLW